ncbi:MAG: hypothetical protein KDM81_12140, partial [Verrucomicrobiae bacterium]|nr:hypothetical protein [Verrucomicrobiae bacterium]
MKRSENWIRGIGGLGLSTLLLCASTAATQAADPMEVARQLNQAFIQVAEKVSAAVVVIEVEKRMDPTELGGNNDDSLWEMLPPRFRRQF